MAHGSCGQTATKANTNSIVEASNREIGGKYPMADAKEALHFLQRHAVNLMRSVSSSAYVRKIMESHSTRDALEALKTDMARLVTSPTFWVMLVLGCITGCAGCVVALMWVICAPLFLRNCDFLTWALRENKEKYKGKVVWVTGGSSGIGLSLCKHLSLRGIKGLIITGRYIDRLEKAKEELLSFAASRGASIKAEDVLLLPLDLSTGLRPQMGGEEATTSEAWEQMVHQAVHWRGGVDILFNNAGRLSVGCLPPTETFSEVIDANFMSAVKLTNLILPHMRAKDQGHIVFTNSSSGEAPAWPSHTESKS
ncbi:hypothetical protein Efla_005773 [Eimeria flavescens]